MKLPRIILQGLKKTKALTRIYPKDKPEKDQIQIHFFLLANSEGACGFLIQRQLRNPPKPGDKSSSKMEEYESFYEPHDILSALRDYNQDVMPEKSELIKTIPQNPPNQFWRKPPKIVLEKKLLDPDEEDEDKKRERKFFKVPHPTKEAQIRNTI